MSCASIELPPLPAGLEPSTPYRPKRNMWHGLDSGTEAGDDAYFARLADYEHACRSTGAEPLMPGFTHRDGDGLGFHPVPDRDIARARLILSDTDAEHEDRHWFYWHPFCGACTSPRLAANLLARWLTLNPGRTPRDEWDGFTLPLPPGAETQGAEKRSPFYTYDELGDLPEPEWLIHGLVPQGGIGYVTGRDGSYKTFLAIDIAISAVAWTSVGSWHGNRPIEVGGWGRALILEGEGVGSMRKRVDAALLSKGIDLSPPQREGLVIRNGTVDLYGGNGDFHALLAFVRDFQPDIVIVDTLNRSAGAADQNLASSMSVITARLHAIAEAAEERADSGERCTVITVAHTDKGDNDARGSSAIEDDADFVLHCKKAEDRLAVKVAKMKDGESGFTIDLRAKPFGDSIALVDAEPADGLINHSRTRRLDLARKIRDELERHPGLSQAKVAEAIKGRKVDIAQALAWLMDEGYVTADHGPRNSYLHRLTDKRLIVGEGDLNLDGLGDSE